MFWLIIMHFVRINRILSSQIYLSFHVLAYYKAAKLYYVIKDIAMWGNCLFYLRLTHSAKKGLSIRYPPTGFYVPGETFLKIGTRTEKLVADGATIFKRAHVPFSFSLCIFALCIFALCSFAQRAYDTTKNSRFNYCSRHHFQAGAILIPSSSRSSSHVTIVQSSTLISLLASFSAVNSRCSVAGDESSHDTCTRRRFFVT